jgi:hypothetical protein
LQKFISLLDLKGLLTSRPRLWPLWRHELLFDRYRWLRLPWPRLSEFLARSNWEQRTNNEGGHW